MEKKSSPSINDNSEDVSIMAPKFLPAGELLGWNLHTVLDPDTNTIKGTYTVSVQVSRIKDCAQNASNVQVTCDGPCGGTFKSNRLISMGKCDHVLCKACFGLVSNPDGSYGCSNFYCWADARKSFRQEKNNYRHVIKKQMARATALKSEGEDLKVCTDANLPDTPCSTPPRSPVISPARSKESSDPESFFSSTSGTSDDSYDFSG